MAQEEEDNMKNTIQTTAPIDIQDLKKYFENKETFFEINYTESTIKAEKLLVYISNLDIPCDIKVNSSDETQEILKVYLESSFLVNLPSLEKITISLLLQNKGLVKVTDKELLDSLKPQLDNWTEKLDSLPLFNLYSIKDDTLKEWAIGEHEENDTTDLSGVNFVSLLKYKDFYYFYQKMDSTPKYYSKLFNEYMFKGNNLYTFWANENNPMFLLTYAIATDTLEVDKYIDAVKQTTEETA